MREELINCLKGLIKIHLEFVKGWYEIYKNCKYIKSIYNPREFSDLIDMLSIEDAGRIVKAFTKLAKYSEKVRKLPELEPNEIEEIIRMLEDALDLLGRGE